MQERLLMSVKECNRKAVLARIVSGEVSQAYGAKLLKLSYRQMKRIYRQYRLHGSAGLAHGHK